MLISDWSADVCSSDRAMRAAMIDKAHTNDPRPPAEDQDPGQGSKKDGGLAAEPVDPRILTIARAIGRLIARERFEELTDRSEEHTSELQSLMRISYAVLCLKKKKTKSQNHYLTESYYLVYLTEHQL